MESISGITLSELQERIRSAVSGSFPDRLWVRCEINAVTESISGHCYLDLVDKPDSGAGVYSAKASGVIWSSLWKSLSLYFKSASGSGLSAGMKVRLCVQPQYSALYGLTLVVYDIDPAYTFGEAALARQRTIARLKDEGMFDMNASLRLCRLPRRFAVISSEGAAGYGDFMKHLHGNSYGFRFFTKLYPALVQGDGAPASIVSAMDSALEDNGRLAFDAVLIVRGGGSAADLSCYDNYDLCANVAQFPLPVMVAVGHERDRHICDDVARVSVKTPTALADYIVSAFVSEDAALCSMLSGMRLAAGRRFSMAGESVAGMRLRLGMAARAAVLRGYGNIDACSVRLRTAVRNRFAAEKNRLDMIGEKVRKSSPGYILSSGYSIAYGAHGRLGSVNDVSAGDSVKVLLRDGTLDCIVNNISFEDGKYE